jgi:nucleoid-associated protein YgaU
MTTHLMARSKVALAALTALSAALFSANAFAQTVPVTPAQKATATEVAQGGVALSELAANAPDSYTVKGGDTLWAISSLFLKSPWRWPELWGMNLQEIKNPHLIYPGQTLTLERSNGRATLKMGATGNSGSSSTFGASGTSGASGQDVGTVRVSPKTRYETLADLALPTLRSNVIEPFLVEPLIVTEAEFLSAPRIVSTQEGRVLLSRGDRAYARGQNGAPLLDNEAREKQFRVFRTSTALKDPGTGEVLGFEALYAGKATLVRGETTTQTKDSDGKMVPTIVPATIDITAAKEEMRIGDRLMPEPARQVVTYTPRAPAGKVDGRIVSVYGSAVVNAAQNQVVTINKGSRDGMEPGTVMAILKDGERLVDKQDVTKPIMKLPDERNGLLMVFRTFDRVSYALVLEITDTVRVGDRLTNPR